MNIKYIGNRINKKSCCCWDSRSYIQFGNFGAWEFKGSGAVKEAGLKVVLSCS